MRSGCSATADTPHGAEASLPDQMSFGPGGLAGPPAEAFVRWHGHDATIVVRGELDCASAPALSAQLTAVVAGQPHTVVLDLAGVTFMDCSGLTPIARARRMLPAGSPIILRSPARLVRKLLTITHMDQVCLIEPLAAGPRARGSVTPG